MSAEHLKSSVLVAYQGFQTGKLDPLLSLVADDVEWINYEDSPLGGTFQGKDEVLKYIQESAAKTELQKFELESLLCEGNKMIGVLKITYKVKATGKIRTGIDVHLMDFHDDKVVRFREICTSVGDAWG